MNPLLLSWVLLGLTMFTSSKVWSQTHGTWTSTQNLEEKSLVRELNFSAYPSQDPEEAAWPWFYNAELKVLYLDLARFGHRFYQLDLRDAKGQSQWLDDALDLLPSDAVYEIDVQDWASGNYALILTCMDGKTLQQALVLP